MILTTFLTLAALAQAQPASHVVGEPQQIATGHQFTEGPVWMPEGYLLFSDIPADHIYALNLWEADGSLKPSREGLRTFPAQHDPLSAEHKKIFRDPSGQSNGLTVDNEGRLIAAEHKNRRVSRTEKDGTITVLAEKFEGKRFNSPNDVIVAKDGSLFFTDPPYGLEGGLEGPNADLDFCGVYALKEGGEPQLLARDFPGPNGLALSPDEKTLYVADSMAGHLRAFDVAPGPKLENGRIIAEMKVPDGIRVHPNGNIWATADDGVRIIAPDGKLLETVKVPEPPANCAFGGPKNQSLFVTARTSVYAYQVRAN